MHNAIDPDQLQRACQTLEQVASQVGRADSIVTSRIRSDDEGGGADVVLSIEPSVFSEVNLSTRLQVFDHQDLTVDQQLLSQVKTIAQTWANLAETLATVMDSKRVLSPV